eukprot:SAG11_NODE_9733_length_884_cov_3.124841_2_plen_29_part_01
MVTRVTGICEILLENWTGELITAEPVPFF